MHLHLSPLCNLSWYGHKQVHNGWFFFSIPVPLTRSLTPLPSHTVLVAVPEMIGSIFEVLL